MATDELQTMRSIDLTTKNSGSLARAWWSRLLSLRASLVAIALTVAVVGVIGSVAVGPASAESIGGVEFGWVDSHGTQTEYAWARASDATLAEIGVSTATSLACRAVTEDLPHFTRLCKSLVEPFVVGLISRERLWPHNGGHWVRFYPHELRLEHGSF
jgi:hypothetical protein